jgi:hypothetical protein
VRQNHLAIPNDDSRVFYVENQSCSRWALGDATVDPPVVRDGSVVENETLSGFAIQVVLFEASMGALEWCAGGFMVPRGRTLFLPPLSEVPLRPWTWPNDLHFFVAPGILAHVYRLAEDEAWVFASATSEEQILDLARRNEIKWTGEAPRRGP